MELFAAEGTKTTQKMLTYFQENRAWYSAHHTYGRHGKTGGGARSVRAGPAPAISLFHPLV
jgi:hypothetical protein